MIRRIFFLLLYAGFTMSINGIGAPWIAASFHLSESGIAGLFTWISLAAFGALGLSRMLDRVGRHRMIVTCAAGMAVCALLASLSTNIVLFIVWEIGLYAFGGAAVSGAVVMLAEELAVAERARGQSIGGLGITLGAGVSLALMPALVGYGYSWRWLLVLSAFSGIFVMRMVSRAVPESARWERAAVQGSISASRFFDVFGPRYRRRAIPILICSLIGTIAGVASNSWNYFHAVSVVGLSAGTASLMMLMGGGIGLLGFPIGARCCEWFGRVPTAVVSGLLIGFGSIAFYWGPPAHFGYPALWLGAAFSWFIAAQSAATVGGNSAATELFPTAIRGTMMGWFAIAGAGGSISAQALIAILAHPMGGLSVVAGYLGLLTIVSSTLFGLFIPETRGLELEAASLEEPP